MIRENFFFINKLKNVVFLGEHNCLEQFIKINKSLNLKTKIITSPDQSRLINKKIEFEIFKNLNKDFDKFIAKNFNIKETLFLSIRSRWIFKKEKIKDFFKFNLINYHPSRLPVYAGGADISWKIMREDRIDCQLFHLVDENIDGGPIIFYEKSILPKECRLPIDLQNYSNEKIVSLYRNFIQLLSKKKQFPLNNQSSYLGHYYPRLYTKNNGWIDWNMNSTRLARFINAFDDPYPGASTMINNQKVYLKKTHLHGGELTNHPYMSGIVTRHDVNWIVVSASDENSLLIEVVLNEKKENILKKIKCGDRFYTPPDKILLSKSYRPKFGPEGLKK
jgi:methionyl-tRNA formyltransferase